MFKIQMKIADDVYKIKGDGNIYLILKPVPILIDNGDYTNKEYTKSEIQKIISLEKIKIILLTHLHYDHVGNIELFPNAEIYANAEEIKNYKENSTNFSFNSIPKNVDDILKKKLKPLPTEIGGLEVINVPGHTKGSVAFLDRQRSLLFSGDTLFSNGIGRTDLPNSVPEKMNESVKKLIDKIKDNKLLLCPGHDY